MTIFNRHTHGRSHKPTNQRMCYYITVYIYITEFSINRI